MDGIVAYALAKKAMGSTIGDLENLVTNEQGDIVDAVNEVAGNIGSLDDLTTDDHSNLVHAINEVVANVDGLGSISQPDWNQNDENADDYIKNRPFYKGDEDIITLIPETTLTVSGGSARLRVEDGGVAFNIAKDNVGKDAKIQCNDVIEYEPIRSFGEGDQSVCGIYAPTAIIQMNNTGYSISVSYVPANVENVVVHASIDNTEINKISSDYLPFPSIEGAGSNSIILNGSLSGCNADGDFAVAEGSSTTASGPSSHAEGYSTTASANYSHAEGFSTKASGSYSHAEGNNTTASGESSHAEGSDTVASEFCSHAEGFSTKAFGIYSHAEGDRTTASKDSSHAEGGFTTASENYSHAEGFHATASGAYAHAEGDYTIANHQSQHVFGEYNIADTSSTIAGMRGNYVEIVGNGTKVNARSNARTLDWSGNEWLAGNLTAAGGTLTIGATALTEAKLQELISLSSASGVSF